MIWIDDEAPPRVPPVPAPALRAMVAARPDSVPLKLRLGDVLVRDREFADAADILAAALAQDADGFDGWTNLVLAYRLSDRPGAALAAAEQGARVRPSAALTIEHGRVLRALDAPDAAEAMFRTAAEAEPVAAHGEILRLLALAPDGARLLAACDAAQARIGDTALVRAHRALAHSRMGEVAAARQLIDVERHVVRQPVAAPEGHGDIAAFNAALAAEILRVGASDGPVSLRYLSPLERQPLLAVLLGAIRAAMQDYVADLAIPGLAGVMPPPPARGTLFYGNTVLRGRGVNGAHIHGNGYVSAVYHVAVPDSVAAANDDRGALALGPLGHLAPDHTPCWGTRLIRPEPGWLTLFPSHMFHDVVPSLDPAPRISVAADLLPR